MTEADLIAILLCFEVRVQQEVVTIIQQVKLTVLNVLFSFQHYRAKIFQQWRISFAPDFCCHHQGPKPCERSWSCRKTGTGVQSGNVTLSSPLA